MRFLATAAGDGFSFGLLVSGYAFGLRHGIDWDHIAAITDIAGSQDERRESLWFGTLYALGHAVVVMALGIVAIVIGGRLPASIDKAMEYLVGATLLLLGLFVFTSLVRHGRDFRMRSRWMLLFAGIRRSARWVRARAGRKGNGGVDLQTEDPMVVPGMHHGHHGRLGHHHHDAPEPDDLFPAAGPRTSFGIGMIHGVGAETPTQVLIFLAAAGAGGSGAGVAVLVAFVLGLLTSNSVITFGSAFGFMSATRNFSLYATIAIVTGGFSLALGILFLIGRADVLPAFFGG